jgi:hypothetical protein
MGYNRSKSDLNAELLFEIAFTFEVRTANIAICATRGNPTTPEDEAIHDA